MSVINKRTEPHLSTEARRLDFLIIVPTAAVLSFSRLGLKSQTDEADK